MSVLVTGSAGFLGQHIVRALLDRGDYVVGLVRDHVCARDHFPPEDRRVVVHGDLSSDRFLERVLAEHEVDSVIHLAAQAQVSVAKADPIGTWKSNVCGTWNILEACRRQAVRRVVVASSDKSYADGPAPYVETQPVAANGVYATSKAMADLCAQAYGLEYGLPVQIVRCGNLYGPGHRNFSTIIPNAIRSALTGVPLVLRSDGTPRRDFLFVLDAVEGYLRVLDHPRCDAGPAEIWNFGTGKTTSVRDVVESVGAVVGRRIDVEYRPLGAMEIRAQWLDASKAKSLLGWSPEHNFAAGLTKTVPWYKELLGVR